MALSRRLLCTLGKSVMVNGNGLHNKVQSYTTHFPFNCHTHPIQYKHSHASCKAEILACMYSICIRVGYMHVDFFYLPISITLNCCALHILNPWQYNHCVILCGCACFACNGLRKFKNSTQEWLNSFFLTAFQKCRWPCEIRHIFFRQKMSKPWLLCHGLEGFGGLI